MQIVNLVKGGNRDQMITLCSGNHTHTHTDTHTQTKTGCLSHSHSLIPSHTRTCTHRDTHAITTHLFLCIQSMFYVLNPMFYAGRRCDLSKAKRPGDRRTGGQQDICLMLRRFSGSLYPSFYRNQEGPQMENYTQHKVQVSTLFIICTITTGGSHSWT